MFETTPDLPEWTEAEKEGIRDLVRASLYIQGVREFVFVSGSQTAHGLSLGEEPPRHLVEEALQRRQSEARELGLPLPSLDEGNPI